MRAHRKEALWLAALVHRISGLLLAVFLPIHFLALGLAIEGEAKLESFLRWSENPLVKIVEMGLVFLLTVHLLGGVRLLILENLPWRNWQKTFATAAAGVAVLIAFGFLFRAI